jgi:hypothetical protein
MRVQVYKFMQDQDVENPRDFGEPLGKMYTWHRRYTLGGEDDLNCQPRPVSMEQWLWDEFTPKLEGFEGHYIDDGRVLCPPTDQEKEKYYALRDTDGEETDEFGYLMSRVNEEVVSEEQSAAFLASLDKWRVDNVEILNLYLYDHSGITISTSPFSCPWDSGQVGFIWTTAERCWEYDIAFWEAAGRLEGEVKDLDYYLTGDVWGFQCYEFDKESLDEDLESDLEKLEVLYQDENLISYYEFEYSGDMSNDLSGWLEGNAEQTDSCWWFYGQEYIKEYCKQVAVSSANALKDKLGAAKEASRRTYWCM